MTRKEKRYQILDELKYDNKTRIVSKKVNRVFTTKKGTFGKSIRKLKDMVGGRMDVPGPGEYDLSSKIEQTAKQAKKPKNKKTSKELQKMIKTQRRNDSFQDQRSKSFENPQRPCPVLNDNPGPGDYEPYKSQKSGNLEYSFGTGSKFFRFNSQYSGPNPSTYHIKDSNGFDDAIGLPDYQMYKLKGVTFTESTRTGGGNNSSNKQTRQSPGPDTYKLRNGSKYKPSNDKKLMRKTYTFGIKRSNWIDEQIRHQKNLPGPSDYLVKYSQSFDESMVNKKTNRRVSVRRRTSRDIKQKPYSTFKTYLKKKQKRDKRIKQTGPGPGSYNICGNILSKRGGKGGGTTKFNKSARNSKDPNNSKLLQLILGEVGPSTYKIESTVPQLQPWEHKKVYGGHDNEDLKFN